MLTVAQSAHVRSSQVRITGVQNATTTKRRVIALTATGVTVSYVINYANSSVAPNITTLATQLSSSSFTSSFKQNLISAAAATNDSNIISFVNAVVAVVAVSAPIIATAQPTKVPTAAPVSSALGSTTTSSSKSSLSGGDIAAAVIMSVFGACLIAGVVYYLCRGRSKEAIVPMRGGEEAYFEEVVDKN